MAIYACPAGVDMTQEALKLALEALENGDVPTPENAGKNLDAITAIKEALAQTQEPVAWAHYDTFNNLNSLTTARFKATLATKNTGACCIALYIIPPQRTWVGLTDKEIDSYFENHGWSPSKDYYPVIKAIEVKLKELNT
jgi:hypothetical protein